MALPIPTWAPSPQSMLMHFPEPLSTCRQTGIRPKTIHLNIFQSRKKNNWSSSNCLIQKMWPLNWWSAMKKIQERPIESKRNISCCVGRQHVVMCVYSLYAHRLRERWPTTRSEVRNKSSVSPGHVATQEAQSFWPLVTSDPFRCHGFSP